MQFFNGFFVGVRLNDVAQVKPVYRVMRETPIGIRREAWVFRLFFSILFAVFAAKIYFTANLVSSRVEHFSGKINSAQEV
ncbi:hypothetical protein D3C75_1298040 [compost metagenome]